MKFLYRIIVAMLCAAMLFASPAFADGNQRSAQDSGETGYPSTSESAPRQQSADSRSNQEATPAAQGQEPSASPQASCDDTGWANWGRPYAGETDVAGQDRSTVQWRITNDCILHLSGGTSPDIPNTRGTIPWNNKRSTIVGVKVEGNLTLYKNDVRPNPMFYGMNKLTSVDTTGGTLHLVESAASSLFDSDPVLATINGITSWDTSETTGMNNMFYYCPQLTQLDLSGFNTSQVDDMSYMFAGSSGLTSVNFSGFDTGAVTSMSNMFAGCSGFTSIDTSHFNTGQVVDMSAMFKGCGNVTSFDLSGFDTSGVADMSYMFKGCANLASLKLTGFDTSNVSDMSYLFDGCTSLDTLDISDFNTTEAESAMPSMLPNGLRRLVLGPSTQLSSGAFADVDNTINWEEMASLETGAAHIGHIGSLDNLKTRAASANPAGVYMDARLLTTSVKLVVDANGGSTNFAPISVDTTNNAATLTVPQGTVLTRNRMQSLFAGWNTCKDGGTTGDCKPYAPNDTISVSQDDTYPSRTITLYAQWTFLTAPTINGDPIVHASASGGTTVDLTVANTSAPAGSNTTVTTGQGTWSNETGPGTWNYTGRPIADLAPTPGTTYTINAATTMTDAATGHTVASNTTTKTGVLPYANIAFDANGGTGAPTGITGFADTTNGNKLPFAIPANVIPTKGEHDMFAGWSTDHTAANPDPAYNPGNPIVGQTVAGQTTTLYAVWHDAKAPVITEAHRDPSTNRIRITGSAQPWSSIGTTTITGTASRGLKISGASSFNGQATINGTVNDDHGMVVKVRARACPAGGPVPAGHIGWTATPPIGCNEVEATPASSEYPSFPTWISGTDTSWSVTLPMGGASTVWVYTQYQNGTIDGPFTISPLAQGVDNRVRVCAKPTGSASSNYVCGVATWDSGSAPWNGSASHSWMLDLPASTALSSAGDYDIKANLEITDIWRQPGTGTVISPDALLSGTPISGLYTDRLPFTGSPIFRRTVILMAAITVTTAALLSAFVGFRRYFLRHQLRPRHGLHSR